MLKHVACWNEKGKKGKKKRTSKKQNVNNQVQLIQSKLSSLLLHEIKGEISDEMELKIKHVEEKARYKFDKAGCRGLETITMK